MYILYIHARHIIFLLRGSHTMIVFIYIFKLLSTTVGTLLYSRKGILYMGGNAYVTGCVYQAINKKIKKKYENKPVWGK